MRKHRHIWWNENAWWCRYFWNDIRSSICTERTWSSGPPPQYEGGYGYHSYLGWKGNNYYIDIIKKGIAQHTQNLAQDLMLNQGPNSFAGKIFGYAGTTGDQLELTFTLKLERTFWIWWRS
jgi:hypothetical protein